MRPFILVFFYITDELLSLGTPLASGLFAVFAVVFCLMHPDTQRGASPSPRIGWAFFALLLFGTVGAVLSGTRLTPLFAATVLLLYALWWSGARLPPASALVTPGAALFGVLLSTLFVVIAGLGFDLFATARGIPSNRPAGLFLEPSHLAIYTLPLWLIAFSRPRYRPLLLICLLILAPTQFTFSMAAVVLAYAGLRAMLTAKSLSQSLRSLSKVGIALALAAWVVYLVPDLLVLDGVPLATYMSSRLLGLGAQLGEENFSLSPLVVLQGVELAGLSIAASDGLGVGLGNLGINEAIFGSSASRAIIITATADGSDLNLRDGGILINKLAGEVGILLVVILWVVIVAWKRLRALPASLARHVHLVFLAVIATLLLVRALPYFAAPTCLAILSLASLAQGGLKKVKRRRRRRPAATVSPHATVTLASGPGSPPGSP